MAYDPIIGPALSEQREGYDPYGNFMGSNDDLVNSGSYYYDTDGALVSNNSSYWASLGSPSGLSGIYGQWMNPQLRKQRGWGSYGGASGGGWGQPGRQPWGQTTSAPQPGANPLTPTYPTQQNVAPVAQPQAQAPVTGPSPAIDNNPAYSVGTGNASLGQMGMPGAGTIGDYWDSGSYYAQGGNTNNPYSPTPQGTNMEDLFKKWFMGTYGSTYGMGR